MKTEEQIKEEVLEEISKNRKKIITEKDIPLMNVRFGKTIKRCVGCGKRITRSKKICYECAEAFRK